MIAKNVTALEYGEAVDLNSIQSELEEVRAAVKVAKTELNRQEYKLSYLKIAEQTAIAKQEHLKNSKPDLGRSDDWDE